MKFLHHRFFPGTERWYPLLGVYYLTYACDFRCIYCSDGYGRPYYSLKDTRLPAEGAIGILGKIRRYCRHLIITGGEPLEHPNVINVLERVPSLKFSTVVFTTNGYDLEGALPVLSRTVTDLVVSVDTLDEKKACTIWGVDGSQVKTVMRNIDAALEHRSKRFGITVSSVIMPETIDDQYALFDFCMQRGITFAACPRLMGVTADPGLENNAEYRKLFNHLIVMKKRGARVFGTVPYLEYMRELRHFTCDPFTMLTVSPEGNIYYPCLEKGNICGSLMDTRALHEVRQEGMMRFGPKPRCGRQCHSACALGFGVSLHHTCAAAMDAIYRFRGGINGSYGF